MHVTVTLPLSAAWALTNEAEAAGSSAARQGAVIIRDALDELVAEAAPSSDDGAA